MSALVLTLTIDAAQAARECRNHAGPVKLTPSADDLEYLTTEQRDTLARHVNGEPYYGEPLTRHAPPIGHADVTVLAMLLDARRRYVAAKLAAQTSGNGSDRQQRIARALYRVDRAKVRRLVADMHEHGISDGDALVLAASLDPVIRDALNQVATVWRIDDTVPPSMAVAVTCPGRIDERGDNCGTWTGRRDWVADVVVQQLHARGYTVTADEVDVRDDGTWKLPAFDDVAGGAL